MAPICLNVCTYLIACCRSTRAQLGRTFFRLPTEQRRSNSNMVLSGRLPLSLPSSYHPSLSILSLSLSKEEIDAGAARQRERAQMKGCGRSEEEEEEEENRWEVERKEGVRMGGVNYGRTAEIKAAATTAAVSALYVELSRPTSFAALPGFVMAARMSLTYFCQAAGRQIFCCNSRNSPRSFARAS